MGEGIKTMSTGAMNPEQVEPSGKVKTPDRVRQVRTWKACKHYASFGADETNIIPSRKKPSWNAWLEIWVAGKKVYSDFRGGLYWEYLKHLLSYPECCQEIGVSREEVEKAFQEAEKEWEEAARYGVRA
jgi:hypothetical protein